jgi:hypothetical protein
MPKLLFTDFRHARLKPDRGLIGAEFESERAYDSDCGHIFS